MQAAVRAVANRKTEAAPGSGSWAWCRAIPACALQLVLGVTLITTLPAAPVRADSVAAPAKASPATDARGFYRWPTLHGDTLVFVAEGDLWRVGVQGGRAERLTTHPAEERSPAFSPDGRSLAFNASYDGSAEAYLMRLDGGLPRRLTWSGAGERVVGFAHDGRVLLEVPDPTGRPGRQLALLDPSTLARQALPVAGSSDGALMSDGRTLLFTRGGLYAARADNVAGYRGGNLARLWSLDLASDHEAVPLSAADANARLPMPMAGGARLAFLSDRDGRFNLWSMDRSGRAVRQHTRHRSQDIRHASLHGSRVVYALGADLHLHDLSSGEDRVVPITLGSDFAQRRSRRVPAPPFFSEAVLAPDGQQAAVVARGRIAVVRTGTHRRIELPVPADARCRAAVFAHDSRSVLAVCDTSGEQEIWRLGIDGSAPLRLTTDGDGYRHRLFPSPDGRWVAHTDHRGRLLLTELTATGTGATRLVEQARSLSTRQGVVWSPDSRLMIYTRVDSTSSRNRLVLHRLADGRTELLTSDRYDSELPVFTPDGRWLYFVSSRHFEAQPTSPWGDRNLGPSFDRRGRVYALALQTGLRFPFQPRDELSPGPGEGAVRSAMAAAPTASASAARPEAQLDGIASRLYEVPLAPGNYTSLFTDGRRLFFGERSASSPGLTMRSIAIGEPPLNPATLLADVASAEASADGRRLMLVRRPASREPRPGELPPLAGEILIVDAAERAPAELAPSQLRWADWLVPIEPMAEWRQIFADAWRMQRDFHFDRGLSGVDWAAERRRHEPLLARVTDRHDLSELLEQMVTSLGTLHSQVRATDVRRDPLPQAAPAELGARLSTSPGGVVVDRPFGADPELPTLQSPLRAAGIEAGEVIVAVNGRSVADPAALHAALHGQAGSQVLLSVRNRAGTLRPVVVQPVTAARHAELRLADWEWSNAQRALEHSGGRVGYLRLRAMSAADMATFVRELYSHLDRDGVILDLRGNSGGNIDSWILSVLARRPWVHWQHRSPDGAVPFPNMQQSLRGRVVALIDENTYSDGETLAEGLRRLGLGTLIGRRTTGAGVWLADRNRAQDGSIMRVAEFAQFAGDGWLIERVGVAPDIEVDNPPRATASGRDAQLDAAIAHLLAQPAPPRPVAPPYARPFP